jgi:hypothetical protein
MTAQFNCQQWNAESPPRMCGVTRMRGILREYASTSRKPLYGFLSNEHPISSFLMKIVSANFGVRKPCLHRSGEKTTLKKQQKLVVGLRASEHN